MYKADVLARYIVDKCTNDGQPITNLQLQKILYFIQLNFIKIMNVAAFNEDMEAWQHGPVIPEVYSEYSYCGGTPIFQTYEGIEKEIKGGIGKEIIDTVVELAREMNPWDLVRASHAEGTPWQQVYNGMKTIIPKSNIYEYARSLNNE